MFIDTNVLVYARNRNAPNHHLARDALQQLAQGPEPLRISRQVIREYLGVVTRPQAWSVPLTSTEAVQDVNSLNGSFDILADGPEVMDALLALIREVPASGRQIHDANIVATMLAHRERRLLTFNTADFRRYGDRIELIGS